MKAMSQAPDERYPSIEALKEAVEGFLHGGAWFAERRFPPGTVVVRQGDDGHAAYIIIAGRCEAYKDEPAGRTKLREMGPGDVFGETAIFTAQPRTASVVVIGSDDLTAIEITRDSLAEELALDSWMGAFVRALAVRFRDLDSRLSAMRGAEERARMLTWLRDWVVAVGTPSAESDSEAAALEAPWSAGRARAAGRARRGARYRAAGLRSLRGSRRRSGPRRGAAHEPWSPGCARSQVATSSGTEVKRSTKPLSPSG